MIEEKSSQQIEKLQSTEVGAGEFIDEIVRVRAQNPTPSFTSLFGELPLEIADIATKYNRDPNDDFMTKDVINKEISQLITRLNPSDMWSDSFIELTAFRIAQEAKQIGHHFDAGMPLVHQVKKFLSDLKPNDAIEFFKHHILVESARRANGIVPKSEIYRGELFDLFKQAVDKSILPADFDFARAESLITKLQFRAPTDFLFFSGDNSYQRYDHAIYSVDIEADPDLGMSSDQALELARVVRVHEGVHSLSGRSIIKNPDADENSEVEKRFFAYKFGLSFVINNSEQNIGRVTSYRYGWLNEAVTELIAASILGREGPTARLKEIEVFRLLVKKGKIELPWQLFLDAYFEDSDISKEPDQRLPKWNSLQQAVSSAYTPEFLDDLDQLITSSIDGLQKAIEFLNQYNAS